MTKSKRAGCENSAHSPGSPRGMAWNKVLTRNEQLCAIAGWILWIFEGVNGLGHRDAWFIQGNGDETKVAQGSFWQVIIDSSLGIAMLKVSIALNLLRLSPAHWYIYCLWVSIGK